MIYKWWRECFAPTDNAIAPCATKSKPQNNRRGSAFARLSFNSQPKSRSANAQPSWLQPINFPCGWSFW